MNLVVAQNYNHQAHTIWLHFCSPTQNINELISLLQKHPDVQCVAGNNFVPFGQAQNPDLFTYADGEDTMQFLLIL